MRRFRLTPLRLAAAVVAGSVACTGVAYAASLGIASSGLYAWSQALTKGSCNQTSTTESDTFVQQSNGTKTNAGQQQLSITGGTTGQQFAFIRFDLSGCSLPTTAGADSAVLTLYVTNAKSHTISFYPVYSSWSPATLNWNGVSGLTIAATATASFTPTTNNTAYTIPVTGDVDAAIKAGTLWGWELKDTTSGGAQTTQIAGAAISQAAERPSMTLSYEK
ncbi:MAG TPA: DNRLRE domain-containing protein [Gaiellaceae bacterium]|nr:DNRLRE domain-containing protein [Gaiellaceae bacterium]